MKHQWILNMDTYVSRCSLCDKATAFPSQYSDEECEGALQLELWVIKCECGAFKTYGAKKGDVGHSSWCPWS